MVHVQFLFSGSCGFFCFVLHTMTGFFGFFGLKLSNCSLLKLVFSEGPSFFVHSVCNHGALKLRLHVVALPASLVLSWLAEITLKLNRSGLDFLVLDLQSSNSFILNDFFHFCFCLFPPACIGSCSVFAFGLLWLFCYVLHGRSGIFLSEIFELFPVKTRFFRRAFTFCTFCL